MEAKCISDFTKFLKDHRTEGMEFTHTSIGNMLGIPLSKFNICDHELPTFLKLYAAVLRTSEKKKKGRSCNYFHMIERPLYVGPILVDIDFKQAYHQRIYNTGTIKYIVNKYNDEITRYLTVRDDLKAFIFEKECPSYKHNSGDYKDGFHIIYPAITVSAPLRYMIHDRVLSSIISEKVIEKMGFTNTVESILDDSIIMRNGFIMYGSSKENSKPYNLTHIFDYNLAELNRNYYSVDDLVHLLSIRANHSEVPLKLEYDTEEFHAKLEESYKRRHPVKKIISSSSTIKSINVDRACSLQRELKSSNELCRDHNNKGSAEPVQQSEQSNARMLTELLSRERASDYFTWLQVGWALHSIDHNLLDCFKTFSQKVPSEI
jgi:hypothetical protein